MRNLFIQSLAFTISFTALLSSCKKEGEHHIKINNQFPDTLTDAMIGPANYGVVPPNTSTDYKQVVNGHNPLTGVYSITDSILTGTVSVNGNDIHKYTLKIDAAGKRTLIEDKK